MKNGGKSKYNVPVQFSSGHIEQRRMHRESGREMGYRDVNTLNPFIATRIDV